MAGAAVRETTRYNACAPSRAKLKAEDSGIGLAFLALDNLSSDDAPTRRGNRMLLRSSIDGRIRTATFDQHGNTAASDSLNLHESQLRGRTYNRCELFHR